MSRRLVYCVLALALIGFVFWKADAGAAVSEAQSPVPAAEGIADEPEDDAEDKDSEEKDADDKDNDDEDADDEDSDAKDDKKQSEEAADEKKSEESKEPNDEKPAEDKDTPAEKQEAAEKPADEKKPEPADDKKSEEPAAADKAKEEEKKEPEKPKPHKVKRKPLKIDVKLDGVFVADQMDEIALRPEVWSQFEVREAVEHGTVVKKGDVLVRFDDEKIEEELANQSIDQRLGELALMQEEEEFPRVEKLLELGYIQAKTAHDQLVQDVEYYHKVDRPFMVRIADYRLKSAKEDLDSQKEELAQLEKMYEADEVTEETEEIVLRRQKFEVATAELVLELQESSHEYTLGVVLPRTDEAYAKQLEESGLKFEQVKTARDMGLTRGKYELEKKREARAKAVERHAELISDRNLMVLRAPTDGTVYYGRCVNGKWGEIGSMTPKLQPFGVVSPNSVLMTVVKQRPLHMETNLTEKQLTDFKRGLTAVIAPSADDEIELAGKVVEILPIPDSANKYELHLDVDLGNAPEWLVAGMSGQATVTVYNNKSALVIPADMVQTDEDDEKIKYVMVLDKDEKPVRRNVKLGRSKDKLVEVLSGLEAGDQIVKEEKEKP